MIIIKKMTLSDMYLVYIYSSFLAQSCISSKTASQKVFKILIEKYSEVF